MAAAVIDFKRVAAAALAAAERLVPLWAPEGRRQGAEWLARNPTRSDTNIGSFAINLVSGVWKDFATGDAGGDLVSLYAYLHGLNQADAARELSAQLGVETAPKLGAPDPAARARTNQKWLPIVPAPPWVPAFSLSHPHYGAPAMRWEYRSRRGELIGYVCRFTKREGGKEIMPACWARSDDSGEYAWRFLAFPKPRPLYRLPELEAKPQAPVLIVEGEKAAEAAARLAPHLACLTWPGGAQAVKHADWADLAGRDVLLWPDADEPGRLAMGQVAALIAKRAQRVRLVALPPDVAQGWDLADAEAEGWSAQRTADWLAEHAAEPSADTLPTPPKVTRVSVLDDWRQRLIWGKRDLTDCRENVYLILRYHPDWNGIIAVDEFAKRVIKRRATPWGPPGEWEEVDDMRLGLWLAQRDDLRLLVRSQTNLAGGVNMAAHDARFHPVREFYDALAWDGIHRLDHWIEDYMDVAVGQQGHDPQYLRLVGRFFLMGMVARIYEPGCVFRMMPIFEGNQNKGKSSALRALAQPWFADTPFALGDKDAFQVIQGVLLYEIAELDSFNKSESTRIKAFISSISDKFRAPYEARPREHARQTVFAGTTNSDEYFKDSTGNTRFAPVACGDAIRYEELAAVRDQLFAEAILAWREGVRRYATREEEDRYFLPEQQRREIADPWFEVIWRWLEKGTMQRVTLTDVIGECLKIEMERVDNARQMATRIGIAMKLAGWRKGRLTAGERSYYWERPGSEEARVVRVQQGDPGSRNVPF